LDKTYSITYANDCSENTSLSDSSNILTTYQNLSTEVPPKSKSKTKSPPQLKGSVPLTVYHQSIRGLRGKVNELLSQLYPCSENTSLSDSSNILTTYQNLSTEVPPRSKSKTKSPPQLKGLVPLTVYHKSI